MVLIDFNKFLNILTDSQYAKRVLLYIETAKFIPDKSELNLLFIQVQQAIWDRNYLLCIIIWSH